MNNSVSNRVKDFISPIVSKLNYELVDVDYSKKASNMNLTIYIDSPHGITLDDCEKLHNAINEPLDILNPTNDESYILNVSSVGLDRPFKTINDYSRNIGNMIELSLYAKIDGKKSFVGKLTKVNDKSIEIVSNEQLLNFDINQISKATKYISF